MSAGRLLVVEDDENLRSMLCASLRYNNFTVSSTADGREALRLCDDEDFDLVVLDVMLPGLDGFEVCRRLRTSHQRMPVVFLTARGTTEDKVRGLTLGGDDYLEKPFSLDELVARLQAVLRRTRNDGAEGRVLALDHLILDEDAHMVKRAGEVVHLSQTEYRLLRYLLINAGRVVSKGQILDHVWGYDYQGSEGIVETYIGYLRRKVDASDPKLIHTIRSAGYVLRRQG